MLLGTAKCAISAVAKGQNGLFITPAAGLLSSASGAAAARDRKRRRSGLPLGAQEGLEDGGKICRGSRADGGSRASSLVASFCWAGAARA